VLRRNKIRLLHDFENKYLEIIKAKTRDKNPKII
jgi:hypothetical protein